MKKGGFWVGRVGGWGEINVTPAIFSKTSNYTKLDFPNKFHQNRAKITKDGH